MTLKPGGALTRGFDRVTHMLVISSSVGMLNGIQRTTSDLRPATSFHLVLQTRSDRLCARARLEQLSSSSSSWYLPSQLEHTQALLFLLPEFRRGVWESADSVMTLKR